MQRFSGEHYSTLTQKAFQYLQLVASSKQQEANILNHLFFAQWKFLFIVHVMSAGYQNYQQQKQTNMTSCMSWIWDNEYKGVKWYKHLLKLLNSYLLFGEEVVEHAQQLQHPLLSPRLRHVVVVDHQVGVDLNKNETLSASVTKPHRSNRQTTPDQLSLKRMHRKTVKWMIAELVRSWILMSCPTLRVTSGQCVCWGNSRAYATQQEDCGRNKFHYFVRLSYFQSRKEITRMETILQLQLGIWSKHTHIPMCTPFHKHRHTHIIIWKHTLPFRYVPGCWDVWQQCHVSGQFPLEAWSVRFGCSNGYAENQLLKFRYYTLHTTTPKYYILHATK